MSVNEDWDVEQHKVEYESDEHWELRRKFLQTHKDKFSEDVLVCLAQVFVNVELLGCRYPQETMELVDELSRDIAADYREKQKKKLQRTFVEASEAASSKVKGCTAKTSTVTETFIPNMPSSIISNIDSDNQSHTNSHSKKNKKFNAKKTLHTNTKEPAQSSTISRQSCKKNPDIKDRPYKRLKTEENVSFKNQDFDGNIILCERPGDNVLSTLELSASVSGMALMWNYSKTEEGWKCSLNIVDSKQLSCSIHPNKKIAKKEAATIALEKLQKSCYTLKIKQDLDTNMTVTSEEIKSEKSTPDEDWKGSNCIGNKLMKIMGWAGGGLGKSEQGIVEPMSAMVKTQINREGLGLKTNSYKAHDIKIKCRKLFKDFLQTDDYLRNDIVFLDFSKEDRRHIHQIAQSMGLKSRSYGKGQRKLIVSRKVNIRSLVRELSNLGGVTEKYELIKPTDEKYVSSLTSTDV